MTEHQAERVADVALALAAVGAAFFILKTPRLRRIAWELLRGAVVGSGPAWVIAETRRGWHAAAVQAPRRPAI
jgi:hypothetical protein